MVIGSLCTFVCPCLGNLKLSHAKMFLYRADNVLLKKGIVFISGKHVQRVQ